MLEILTEENHGKSWDNEVPCGGVGEFSARLSRLTSVPLVNLIMIFLLQSLLLKCKHETYFFEILIIYRF